MNEDYLRQFKKSPSSQFMEKVQTRLEKKERMQTIKRYSALSALTLVFMFGMLMTFSSTVRAEVLRTIEEIAGLQFDVTSQYPGTGEEIIAPSEYLSLEEAQSRFPSPIMLPTYLPQGYEQPAEVALSDLGNRPILTIIWNSKDKWTGNIILDIMHCPSGFENCGRIVGEGSIEEIMLNEKPAVIVNGAWNYDTKQYDLSMTTAIQWKHDENTIYMLSSWSRMPLEELIRMAASIP